MLVKSLQQAEAARQRRKEKEPPSTSTADQVRILFRINSFHKFMLFSTLKALVLNVLMKTELEFFVIQEPSFNVRTLLEHISEIGKFIGVKKHELKTREKSKKLAGGVKEERCYNDSKYFGRRRNSRRFWYFLPQKPNKFAERQ